MPPRSLPQSSSLLCVASTWSLTFPLPPSLLFFSFRSIFFLSSSLLLTSLSTHPLSLPFCPLSFLLSHVLLSSPVPLSIPPSLLSLSHLSPSCMSCFLLFFLRLFSLHSPSLPPLNLLSSSFLSLHCSFQLLSLSLLSVPSISPDWNLNTDT